MVKQIEVFKTEKVVQKINDTVIKIKNNVLNNPSQVIKIIPAYYGNYIPQMVGNIFEHYIDYDEFYYENFLFLEDRLSELLCEMLDDKLEKGIDVYFNINESDCSWGLEVKINDIYECDID